MFVSPLPRDDDVLDPGSQNVSPHSNVNAEFAGLILETLLYGALIVTYGSGTWKVLTRKRRIGMSRRDRLLVLANSLMFVFATVHMSLDFYIAAAIGITRGASLQVVSDKLTELNDINSVGAFKTALVVAQMMIGDGFMVYRAYVVWNRRWRIIALPLALLILEVLLGFISVSLGRYHVRPERMQTSLGVYFLVTAATNVLSTALVIKPILFPRRAILEFDPDCPGLSAVRWRIVASILHSAAIFTVSSLLFAITFFTSPLGFFVCHTVFLPAVAIVFSVTITRMCLKTAVPRLSMVNLDSTPHSSRPASRSRPVSTEARRGRRPSDRDSQSGALSPIAIHVSVITTQASDGESESVADALSLGSLKEGAGVLGSPVIEREEMHWGEI